MGHRWYVVRTKSRSEFLAARELIRDDLEVFAPLVSTSRAHNGPIPAPLFPGYIFIRLDSESGGRPSFRFGQYAFGLVNFNGEFPWLSDEVIAELKQRCDSINQEGGIWRRYQSGEMVRIVSSSIQSLAQVVEDGKTPQSRVKILLQFLDRLVPAEVSREDLQPVEEKSESKIHAPRRTRGGGRWLHGFGPRALAIG